MWLNMTQLRFISNWWQIITLIYFIPSKYNFMVYSKIHFVVCSFIGFGTFTESCLYNQSHDAEQFHQIKNFL